jgi:hypothetical protein
MGTRHFPIVFSPALHLQGGLQIFFHIRSKEKKGKNADEVLLSIMVLNFGPTHVHL